MMERYIYNLGQLFSHVAENHANNVALKRINGDKVLYVELDELSNRLAWFMREKGIGLRDVVVILNNKSLMSYALMIACLKIGAIYCNLDPKNPIERFNRMLSICKPKLLFFANMFSRTVMGSSFQSEHSVNYEQFDFCQQVDSKSSVFLEANVLVDSSLPAYIMFTSGSTGFPKGVVVSHQNVLNFIRWSKNTYKTTSTDVFTNINPMHFDNSVFDFYASLFTGAAIVPVDERLTRNPRRLLDALNIVSPTVWFSVPSMLVYMLNMRALKDEDLPNLRVVTFGGEGFPKNQLRKLWVRWGSRVSFVNVYGPTECTCICSSYFVSAADMDSDELLPLGHMAPNFYALIVDDTDQVCERGSIGELLIGGPNVGIGYYNNRIKTQEVFVQDPTVSFYSNCVYKSGDLVKIDPDTGMLLFCGRKDNQIKRMGYRIELEEIENAFNTISAVKESAVIYINNEKIKAKIIACLNASKQDEEVIKNRLKSYLPSYMMPDVYIYLESLPKNQNGKIDRLQLKKELSK